MRLTSLIADCTSCRGNNLMASYHFLYDLCDASCLIDKRKLRLAAFGLSLPAFLAAFTWIHVSEKLEFLDTNLERTIPTDTTLLLA